MSVLDDVLGWSESAPPLWMRDALRRIVTQQEITDLDVEQLVELCKKSHGLGGSTSEPVPLSAAHLPPPNQLKPVLVTSVTHISDVNALAPGETIAFGNTGLTIVYGDNGAGKSGYARILKRACRARGSSEAVLPNALSKQPGAAPTALLRITVGGVATEHVWRDGASCPPELAALSVFDSSAAQMYVSDRTEVRFRPLGLDVLDRLATVSGKVRARLDQERAALEARVPAWPPIADNTEAAWLLGSLTALTSVGEVERVATLSEEERRELGRLAEVLNAARADDPARRAAELKLKAGRVARLSKVLRTVYSRVEPTAIEELRGQRSGVLEAESAARELAQTFDAAARLPGLGQPAWRLLWKAAAAYSETTAYPGLAFPHIDDGALCVLCQQNLTSSAQDRLGRFAEFVRAEAQQRAERTRAALVERERLLSDLDPVNLQRDSRDELATMDPAVSHKVETFLAAAAACRDDLLRSVDGQLRPSVEPPLADLERLAIELETRAGELARAAHPAERAQSERRLAELQARESLEQYRPRIIDEIARRARINAYNSCLRDTDTRGITRLSTELTKRYVTDILVAAFDQELKTLGFTTPELELRAVGGQRGNLYHQVELKYATRAELAKVVSEGEARCVALAAFLAELRGASHASGIVFDDPVSSLDHRWRTRVADRLVRLAKERQVIVFTHELVFLHALIQAADAAGVECKTESVWRSPTTTGHVESALPWAALSTQKRVAWIKNEWQGAEKVFRTQGQQDYAPIATRLYARLRQTWERAVEEVLLCGVVERFRPSVETKRLSQLHDIEVSDFETVEAGMTKCSRWEGGHDQALAANDPLPGPDELARDITDLETWIKNLNQRRKK